MIGFYFDTCVEFIYKLYFVGSEFYVPLNV